MSDGLAPPINYRPADNDEVRKLHEKGWRRLPMKEKSQINYIAFLMFEAMANGWLVSIGVRAQGALRGKVVYAHGYGGSKDGEPSVEWEVEVRGRPAGEQGEYENRRIRLHVSQITAVSRAI